MDTSNEIYINFSSIINTYIYTLPYSIPKRKIQDINFKIKSNLFSPLIPGDKSTYIYTTETKYNNQYAKSYFAFTYKKGGWDCLRHYEILANNCIPLFIDINKCPTATMISYPKNIINTIMEQVYNNSLLENKELINNYIKLLHNYTKRYLTCEISAKYFLNTINKVNKLNKPHKCIKILLISNNILNYSIVMLLYGLRSILNENVVDYPKLQEIYNNNLLFNINLEDINCDRSNIFNKIKTHYFDYIIFGPVGIDENTSYLKDYSYIFNIYTVSEIIYIFGGDRVTNIKINNCFYEYLLEKSKSGLCFVRELNNFDIKYYSNDTWKNYIITNKNNI